MKLKLNRNQIIVLGIAFLFIFYGLAQGIFNISIDKKIIDQVSFVLLIGAGILIFTGRKKKTDKDYQNIVENEVESKKENIVVNEIENKVENIEEIKAENIVENIVENKEESKKEDK